MRRVLITAGANGIGLVMARAFQAAGDRVWVTDVDSEMIAVLPPGIRGSVVDAKVVEELVAKSRGKGYGFRSLLHDVVQSRAFLNK